MPWLQAAALGAALAAAVPPLGWWPLAFVAPSLLLVTVRGRGAGMRLGLGALAGLVWSSATMLPWLAPAARAHLDLGIGGALLGSAALSWLYGGAWLGVLAVALPWLPRPRWLALPAAWVLVEAARSRLLGGAPWSLLGHAQIGLLPLAQLAELGGVAALTFVTVMPGAALAATGDERRRGLVVSAAALVAALAFGAMRLSSVGPEARGETIVVLSGLAGAPAPLEAWAAASLVAPPAALTVWPEGAVPGFLQDDLGSIGTVRAVAEARGWLLFGARRWRGRGDARQYWNEALLVGPDGTLEEARAKARLVPFAERAPWPFPELLARPYDPGDDTAGPFHAGPLRVGALVCWEAIFPEPARRWARDGVDVLVNLTSDRDLGAGAAQQLAFSRFRAIETRRWLLRASGTGVALAVDPAGRVHPLAQVRIAPGATAQTPYVRFGDLVPWAAAGLLLVAALRPRRERDDAPNRERDVAPGRG